MRREQNPQTRDWTFTIGHKELVVHQRYEVLSILNDFLLGLWFTFGSICFFYEGSLKTFGVWLFLIGSVQLLLRPTIRLHRYIYFKRLPDTDHDA
ncbi:MULTISPECIES: YrhK family protein [Halomonadaceae]|uniref:YrhK family protein n=1 Tax=Vreelandella sp. SM1641 TaxID=3126101 RepID=A0AAU7XL80_9GAMM|nr:MULTISPECIES: YrhK family protein [unclassified Halomonas]AJY49275.1 YrhK domain [Halomonas sp. KO116]|tara:strand:+ start:1632 stop:1916 length:285 start_codon:yes stop_codon:yes gene_type:complete